MPQLDLLLDLESRHEQLLRDLDELDRRVAKTLAECQGYRVDAQEAASATEASTAS